MNKIDGKSVGKQFVSWAVVTILAWAGVPVLSKQGAGQLNGFEMTFWINLFAMPVVTLWVLPRRHRQNLGGYSASMIFKLACVGFLGNLVYQILYFSSYQFITAITGSVLVRFGGILFVAASMIFLKEKHSKAYLAAVILASIGSILSTVKAGTTLELSLNIGFWLIFVGTILNTGYQFANNAIKATMPDVRANLFVFKASTLAVIGAWAILSGIGLISAPSGLRIDLTPPLADLAAPLFLGALADGVGFLAFLKMLELSDSVKTTIVSSAVAIIQVFFAFVFFRESATVVSAVLAPALVIIPMVIAALLDKKKGKA